MTTYIVPGNMALLKSMDINHMKETIRNQGDVALAFTKWLLLDQDENAKNSNVVLSPLSIHLVLSLVAAGSDAADADLYGGPRLASVNAVWFDQSLPLNPSFKHVVDTVYKAKLSQVDFKTKAVEVISKVNSWAEKETNGLITEILPPGSVDSLSRLILANALYFKGAWEQKFEASKTQKSEFYLLDGSSIEVPFMSSENDQYLATFDGFKVLALQYRQEYDLRRHFSMYFFLPDAIDGLPSLIEKLDSQSGFIDHHIPYKQVRVGEFKVPKFKFGFGVEVSNTLKGMGLEAPFVGGGLMAMVDSEVGRELCVKNIFHKSLIRVDEEGTEAAAVSVVVAELQCMRLPSKNKMDFVADHPFLFAIRENMTGTLVFVGQVLNPLLTE